MDCHTERIASVHEVAIKQYLQSTTVKTVALVRMAVICSCLTWKSTATLTCKSMKFWSIISIKLKFWIYGNYFHNISVKAVTVIVMYVVCSCLTRKSARTVTYESFRFDGIIYIMLVLKELLWSYHYSLSLREICKNTDLSGLGVWEHNLRNIPAETVL